ncbi:cell division protein FtsX [Shumkonia mesophila]|uniref:cell division protein FtsX n=1 Tax=Shumkonia mesophila TaxID=2838854 RepID=UPI002934984C|nr:cell division protein [Shumkonia mesophila]
MFSRRTDLPLDADILGRFLPWIIAFMVFLAVLATAGMFVLQDAAGRWSAGVARTLTVQIPPPTGERTVPPAEDPRVLEALKILRTTPGIARADVLNDERLASLLEPWLGPASVVSGLPLPRLIDVEIEAGATLDAEALGRRLAEAIAGASVDDHRVWLDRLLRLLGAVEWVAMAILACIGLATVGTVVYTTRTSLAVHRQIIEVLHLIGAQDAYVARQFAWRALSLGLRGGLIGLSLALPALLAVGYLAAHIDAELLPKASLGALQWGMLAAIPLLASAIAMMTARVTVMKTLAAML